MTDKLRPSQGFLSIEEELDWLYEELLRASFKRLDAWVSINGMASSVDGKPRTKSAKCAYCGKEGLWWGRGRLDGKRRLFERIERGRHAGWHSHWGRCPTIVMGISPEELKKKWEEAEKE